MMPPVPAYLYWKGVLGVWEGWREGSGKELWCYAGAKSTGSAMLEGRRMGGKRKISRSAVVSYT